MEYLKRNREIVVFLAKLGGLCLFYFAWFEPSKWTVPIISEYYVHYNFYTLKFLMEPSVWILNNLGFESHLVQLREIDMHDLDFNIVMLNPCLGIDMMFTFVALIVSFPGKWLDRLWFIPIGLVGIQAVNVCRVVGLSISLAVFKTSGPIDHHDLYNLFAVGFIFLMFMAWVNRYEKKEPAR